MKLKKKIKFKLDINLSNNMLGKFKAPSHNISKNTFFDTFSGKINTKFLLTQPLDRFTCSTLVKTLE